jgi:hypothetical protein
MVTLELRQLSVPPGHRVVFHNVSWQEFDSLISTSKYLSIFYYLKII